MSTDRDPTRIIRSWLRTDEQVSADRVLDAVIAELDTTPQRRATRWPAWRFSEMSSVAKIATVAAAVVVVVVAGMAFVIGGRGIGVEASAEPSSSPVEAEQTEAAIPSASAGQRAAAQVPGGFTACVPINKELRAGTDERLVVAHPDGDMTLERRRGFTWAGTITATDERFSGTHYYSWDGDAYTLASGQPGPSVVAEGHRIENGDGAWQGWSMGAGLSEQTRSSPAFLTGEGAYDGLTAILFDAGEGGCFFNFTGVVLEVPAPPVPATSE